MANVNSSLAYEILLYLNTFYLGMFVVCEVAMGILKAINVSYPENALVTEIGIFSILCLVEVIRIFLGRRGNLASKSNNDNKLKKILVNIKWILPINVLFCLQKFQCFSL